LNELSSKFKSNEKYLLINTSNDTRTIFDSLEAFDNGKSNNWCRVNDSVNEVSTKPDNDLAICSDKVCSFKKEEWDGDATNGYSN
jgi:hypothetical protein